MNFYMPKTVWEALDKKTQDKLTEAVSRFMLNPYASLRLVVTNDDSAFLTHLRQLDQQIQKDEEMKALKARLAEYEKAINGIRSIKDIINKV